MPRPYEPACPSWLSREAKAEWRRIVKALPPGLLTVADRQVLTVAAGAWARLHEATKEINGRGVLVDGERGVVKNPALQIARDAESTLARCWAELGLSPAARSRLEMPEPEGDPIESIFSAPSDPRRYLS